MKYTVIAIQTGIKYYVAFDRQHGGCLVDTPKLFDTREEAEIEVYRLHDKDTKNIRKLYYKVWKNTVSWKVFRKGYFKGTRYLVEEIDDNFFNRKILIQTTNLDTIHSEIDKLCENVDKIYNQDRNIIITISSFTYYFMIWNDSTIIFKIIFIKNLPSCHHYQQFTLIRQTPICVISILTIVTTRICPF